MPYPSVLEDEESYLALCQFCVEELDDAVDFRTGEILTERQYTASPDTPQFEAIGLSPFKALTSVHQREQYTDQIDGRTLTRFNGVRRLFDNFAGEAKLRGAKSPINNATYYKLMDVVKMLDFLNVAYRTPQELAEGLQVNPKVLRRHLCSLEPYVRVEAVESGMKRGSLRITIHPVMGFRYFRHGLEAMRMDALAQWQRHQIRFHKE